MGAEKKFLKQYLENLYSKIDKLKKIDYLEHLQRKL